MTDVLTRPATDRRKRRAERRDGRAGRFGRAVVYAALLVPAGVQAMADALAGEPEAAARRWHRLGDSRTPGDANPARSAGAFGYGLLSVVLGLTSWFVIVLAVLAVVRGPFWGFVEHGPVEPGTWGGPTRAGAWTAHALIAVPCIAVFLAALRGIVALHTLLAEGSRRWVLPATIVVAAGSLAFFWSWLQQL